MKKIIVIGCPGAGKTTFSNRLGTVLHISVHHLDRYFWKENWKPTPQEEFKNIVSSLMKDEDWILDGNFKNSIEHRINFADTIILFDFPKRIILWRVLKRFFRYMNTVRPDMGGKNKEAIKWQHIKYILTYPRKKYLEHIQSITQYKKLYIFHTQKDVQDFFNDIHRV